jgi:hypothetical protein
MNKNQIIPHYSKEVDGAIDKISNINIKSSYYLIVLAGRFSNGKEQFLSKMESRYGEINSVDMSSIISKNEENSYHKIDKLFASLPAEDKFLYLNNCDVLSGEYTGFTYSTVRYATPQEKYLLTKIKSSEKVVIMDVRDMENLNNTLKRMAQLVIGFEKPTGFLGKLIWNLKQIRIQGHTFVTSRPI